jgi:hypothetical protein
MSLYNYLLYGNTEGGFPPSFSDRPSGGSSKLVGLVRSNQNDAEPIGDVSAPVPASFAAETGPEPYDETGFLDLALMTQAFGPIPSGLGVSEKGDIIRVNTAALEGPINGGLY